MRKALLPSPLLSSPTTLRTIKRDRLDRGRAQAEANAFHGDRLGFTLCNGDGTSREREDNFLCLAIPHPACSETLNP